MKSNPRLMQDDNDHEHTSERAREWLRHANVNWWKTPVESLDLNSIKTLWHKLKEYLRCVIKPKTKQELIRRMIEFWDSVDTSKTRKYVIHVKKVVSKIIDVNGGPTGC